MAPYPVGVEDVTTELCRVTRRWQQLSADQARENAALVREFAQELADGVRRARGLEVLAIPDLGEAVLADQLTVIVYDACRAGLEAHVSEGLTRLRRALP